MLITGASPSGKAVDSDSTISRVQILPPQPKRCTVDCTQYIRDQTLLEQSQERLIYSAVFLCVINF